MFERQRPWWEPGVIYQVYPRSWQDSNGDGIGDLAGIVSRLDHLVWLGVDALWLSPIFPSPMADFGYDVADYTDVDPIFGTLADIDRLIAEAHARGLRILLDLVPNHTSDQHPWFLESRSSRSSAKRNWYLWADPRTDGGPPNNWVSNFGGSGWTYDEATGQYYYHSFLAQQPDLNWRDPQVRAAMADVLRFWFDRGIDGFRVDVIWMLIKDDQLRDNPPAPDYVTGRPLRDSVIPLYTADRPEVHEAIAELRAVTAEFEDRVLIGEIYLPVERLVRYYGTDNDPGTHVPFNFQLLLLPWDARAIARAIDEYEALLPASGWPNWVLGNHDRPRVASRVGRDQARVAAMLLLTLRGTPTIYYGDEIGMVDVEIPVDRQVDPGRREERGRDPERTPMQWDAGRNAGFSSAEPWLPLAPDWRTVNVAVQRDDARSLLTLHRRLLELRRREPVLAVGAYEPVEAAGAALVYRRRHGGRTAVVALNLGHEPLFVALPADVAGRGRVAISTALDREGEAVGATLGLRADEGIVVLG